MTNGQEKLIEDLADVAEMASQMASYLESDQLFGQSLADRVPPTVGGFLVRQYRLVALKDNLLSLDQHDQLREANKKFEVAARKQPTLFRQKAQQELAARIRQWEQALRDLFEDPSPVYYRTDVETRAIIQALMARLTDVDAAATEKVNELDQKLKQRWQSGDFVWPTEWQPAYPQDKYWWLYGRLQ